MICVFLIEYLMAMFAVVIKVTSVYVFTEYLCESLRMLCGSIVIECNKNIFIEIKVRLYVY